MFLCAGSSFWKRLCACAALGVLLAASGCTSRGMTVTSVPPGAEVSINRRVVGVTPIRVGYTHYGTYRLELRKERYLPLIREEPVNPPIYGYDPLTFVADNLLPARINDEIYLHYVLTPVPDQLDRDSLLGRAVLAREGKVTHPLTQESLEIAMAPPVDKGAAARGEPDAAEAPETGPSPVPDLRIPKEMVGTTPIIEKPPEGAHLGTELGIKGPEPKDTKKEPEKPDPRAKRFRRTPKGEILIYDEPPVEDPEKGK